MDSGLSIILFDNFEVEKAGGDAAEGEARAEHEAVTEQSQSQEVGQGEQEAGANHDNAQDGLEGDVVGQAKAVHDAGHQVTKHEGHIEGEEEEG